MLFTQNTFKESVNNFVIILSLMSLILPGYEVGDTISSDHQEASFEICYGTYPEDYLSLSDFSSTNTVFWINISASW